MRRLAPALLLLAAAPSPAQTVAEQAHALVAAKRDAAAALARAARLERQASAATDAAARARTEAAAIASRISAAEADIAAAEARVRIVEARRVAQRARLARGQAPLARLAAALQTMARRPAGFALVQPGSLDDVVHVRALLAASVPVVERRTAALRGEVAEAERLKGQAAAAARTLRDGRIRLKAEREDLAALAAREKRRSADLADSAADEGQRALGLGERARDIADLMEELGAQAEVRARLAALAGPAPRPDVPGLPGDRAPLAEGPRGYRLPVAGKVIAGLGESAPSGVRSRGLTIAAKADAAIVAPAAGRVAYAGPFRGYRSIVILDHGGGWTSLVTGLSGTRLTVGQRVAGGAPLGRAGGDAPRVTIELRHGATPHDITRLLPA